jgi:hypothetical protein
MIATGFWFWLESRRAEHAREGRLGGRLVEALATGSVTGIIVATLAFLIANRCLPEDANAWGLDRERLEMLAFYAVWLLTFGHAGLRERAAWREQCALVAPLAAIAVVLNWLTTGDYPWRAWGRGVVSVAAMDGVILLLGAVAALVARRWLARAALARPREHGLAGSVVPSSGEG